MLSKVKYFVSIGRSIRLFSVCQPLETIIGRRPIDLPNSVELVTIDQPLDRDLKTLKNTKTLVVKGPLGEVKLSLFSFIRLKLEKNTDESTKSFYENFLTVTVCEEPNKRQHKEMWTTTRTLIRNAAEGVTEGHYSILKINGVGYKAGFSDNNNKNELELKLGYSHPINIKIPDHLKCYVPNPNTIVVFGVDKQQVKLFAHQIRRWRKPEPYKLKGVFVDDEYVKKKEVKKK